MFLTVSRNLGASLKDASLLEADDIEYWKKTKTTTKPIKYIHSRKDQQSGPLSVKVSIVFWSLSHIIRQ